MTVNYISSESLDIQTKQIYIFKSYLLELNDFFFYLCLFVQT